MLDEEDVGSRGWVKVVVAEVGPAPVPVLVPVPVPVPVPGTGTTGTMLVVVFEDGYGGLELLGREG